MRCWKCHTEYGNAIKFCVKCGVHLETGQAHNPSLGAHAGQDEEEPPAGWRGMVADYLPGLFTPKPAMAGLGLGLAGYGLLGFAFFYLLVNSEPMGTLCLTIVGSLVTAQALSFLIIGELWPLHTAAVEFRGKDWTTLLTMICVPVALFFGVMKLTLRTDGNPSSPVSFKKPDILQSGPPKPPPPPPPSPYVISNLASPKAAAKADDDDDSSAGRSPVPTRGPLFVDFKGDFYMAGCKTEKYTSATGEMSAVAGTGAQNFTGDGGPAKDASFNMPSAAVADSKGNVYIADVNCVRKVDAVTHTVNSFIGNGGITNLSGPTSGPAKEVQLQYPLLMAIDAKDNIYIVDKGPMVRKYDAASGLMSVICGKGTDPATEDIPAGSAYFGDISAICADAQGNVLVVDQAKVRRIDATTGMVKTLAPSKPKDAKEGAPEFTSSFAPHGLAADSNGNVFFGDFNGHRVYKADPNGQISIVAGTGKPGLSGNGGEANSAKLKSPKVIGIDGKNVIYLLDNDRIRTLKLAK